MQSKREKKYRIQAKLKTIKVVKNYEILYCDNCDLFATHPEIEQPCKPRPDRTSKYDYPILSRGKGR